MTRDSPATVVRNRHLSDNHQYVAVAELLLCETFPKCLHFGGAVLILGMTSLAVQCKP